METIAKSVKSKMLLTAQLGFELGTDSRGGEI
jgi:hypothetical protein